MIFCVFCSCQFPVDARENLQGELSSNNGRSPPPYPEPHGRPEEIPRGMREGICQSLHGARLGICRVLQEGTSGAPNCGLVDVTAVQSESWESSSE